MTDGYSVDAREAEGVLVGDGSTQINYFYNGTWMGGPTPPPLVGVSGRIESPYRGLSAFGERDAAFFFGRETTATDVLDRMDEHLRRPGLMMVSGVSGAGKSSLMYAGVLPRLRGAGLASAPEAASWPCSVFTPTSAPLAELAVRIAPLAGADAATIRRSVAADPAAFALTARQAATGAGQRRVVLIVDQFEQVFTQCEDEEERRAFLTALHAATTGEEPAALVVLVVRADFEARCADYAHLRTAVQNRYLVTAMTERQMRMAITEPAVRAGSRVDADLVEVLLRETGSPGSGKGTGVLPLLSHALDQAWRGREGTDLRLTDYERTGGVEGAVADSAQRAYDRLSPSQQAIARRIFIRLTTTTAGGVDTADRVERADLIHGRDGDEERDAVAVLESFAAERLITLAADTVQISHEVLLNAWPLLRDEWLAETHADRIIRARLRTAAAEWARNSRDPSYLYGGSLLRDVTAAAVRITADPARHPPLDDTEHAFIQASGRAHRRNRRLRQSLLATLGVLVLALATFAVVALRTGQEAVAQRDTAVANQVAIKSETLGDNDPTLSALDSVAAWQIKHTAEARYSMLEAAARPGIAALPGPSGSDSIDSVAFSPNHRTFAVASENSGTGRVALQLWDAATHQPIGAPIVDRTGQPVPVAFSPDSKTLASSDGTGVVRFWDVATRHLASELHTGFQDVPTGFLSRASLFFSPDGRILVTGDANGVVRLWSATTHQPIGAPLTTPTDPAGSVAISPDGKTVATGCTPSSLARAACIGGRVRLWETATGKPLTELRTGQAITSMAFDRDERLAVASDDSVQLWNTAKRNPIATFTTGGAVAFSADGRLLATASDKVAVWDTATHQQLGAPLAGAAAPVAFGPDGTLASGSGDGTTVRLWTTATLDVGEPLTSKDPESMEFTANDTALAVASFADQADLLSPVTGREIGSLPSGHHGEQIRSVALSADGKTAAIGGNSGTLQLWDMIRHHRTADLANRTTPDAVSMTFSHDGRTLAVGGDNGRVSLWNVPGHRHITDLAAGDGAGTGADFIESMAFTSDGKILATAEEGGTVRLWNMSTYQQSGRKPDSTGTYVAFPPNGRTLITHSDDGTVQTWDTATHRPIGRFSTGPGGSAALSPDGRTLATANDHGDVHLWDIATGQEIGSPLTGSTLGFKTLAFSRDGNTLAGGVIRETGGPDKNVWVWHIDYLRDPLPRLCARAGRSLTRTEWRRDVPPGPAYRPICAKHR